MTQDQYTEVGVAAHDAWEEDAKTNPTPVNPHAYVYGFKAGAQTIIDAPGEWGLVTEEHHHRLIGTISLWQNKVSDMRKRALKAESELSKCRSALKYIFSESVQPKDLLLGSTIKSISEIAKEALKQQ